MTSPRSDSYPIFAATAPGLERLTAAELERLGVTAEPVTGGVVWTGGIRSVAAANLRLRTASRVVVRLATFRARSFIELERHAGRVDWQRFLASDGAVRLRVSSKKSKLYHERAIAERIHSAIQAATGAVPAGAAASASRGPEDADPEEGGEDAQLFVVRFHRDECVISADASGALLHQRGYRQALAKAPLRETLAAALLQASGWRGETPLVDPMCGSGTIPTEAALLARRIAPGIANADLVPRRYAFLDWPDLDLRQWQAEVEAVRAEVLPKSHIAIHGSDRDSGAIQAALSNAERAGVGDDIAFEVRPLSAAEAPADVPGHLITNPPYGVRVGEAGDLRNLYAALGRTAQQKFGGWTLALLSADRALESEIGIRMEERLRTSNGGIPVRLMAAAVPLASG